MKLSEINKRIKYPMLRGYIIGTLYGTKIYYINDNDRTEN